MKTRCAPGGSSPLARGTYVRWLHWCFCSRLIPARAGNMSLKSNSCLRSPAHPRSRGEHSHAWVMWPGWSGSSPLARGTSLQLREATAGGRLIPARAGNMRDDDGTVNDEAAHPRSRGEHNNVNDDFLYNRGSSPLARGTWACRSGTWRITRLIPARAGNIPTRRRCSVRRPAHPRSRGEHKGLLTSGWSGSGSSPLARGTYLLTWGFIPYISKIESL